MRLSTDAQAATGLGRKRQAVALLPPLQRVGRGAQALPQTSPAPLRPPTMYRPPSAATAAACCFLAAGGTPVVAGMDHAMVARSSRKKSSSGPPARNAHSTRLSRKTRRADAGRHARYRHVTDCAMRNKPCYLYQHLAPPSPSPLQILERCCRFSNLPSLPAPPWTQIAPKPAASAAWVRGYGCSPPGVRRDQSDSAWRRRNMFPEIRTAAPRVGI